MTQFYMRKQDVNTVINGFLDSECCQNIYYAFHVIVASLNTRPMLTTMQEKCSLLLDYFIGVGGI